LIINNCTNNYNIPVLYSACLYSKPDDPHDDSKVVMRNHDSLKRMSPWEQ